MVLLGRSSNSGSKQTALFDIRIKGTDHDVLVIKGSASDANSVLLSGTIVLSVLEPMTIKKLNLKLYATLRLKWTNLFETQKGGVIKRPFRYEKRVFEHNWDNFEISNYFSNLYDNYNNKELLSSKNNSSTSLSSFNSKKSKSASNLSTLNNQQPLLLLQGNYEFPFSAILPGSTFESIEGLPGASLVYKLQATIEKGRFSNDLVSKKHLRIVRTLTPDAVELSETVAVDNTWPKKVEYSISIPKRAVAIGSTIPINLTLIPLLKGLRLGKIKITLNEYFSCSSNTGPSHNGERLILENKPVAAEFDLNDDRWEINTFVQIPPSLTKSTQDVDILNYIKVRHKLKFNIGLINPDGHTSELRASLPIVLFISPFVAIGVKNFESDVNEDSFADIPSDSEQDYSEDDEVIFAPDPDLTPAMASEVNSQNNNSEIERQAPPNYENHIYDRLWNEIPIIDTPELPTPESNSPNGLPAEGLNVNKLNETLRRLHIQRNLTDQSLTSLDSITNGASFTLGGDDDEDEDDEVLNFDPVNNVNNGIISPSFTPGYNHISRVNSETNLSNLNSGSISRDWSSTNLSEVPSYQVAMKSPKFDDFSPAYEPTEELSLPKSIHLKSSSLNNSRAQSTAYLSNLRGVEPTSSGSSPTHSRSTSSTQLHSRPPNFLKSGSLSFTGMTPLSSSPNLSSSNKSNSFVNLMGKITKSNK